MTFRCPRGHESTDPDYCSVCGIAMAGPAASAGSASATGMNVGGGGAAAVTGGATATATVCPVCGTPRADMGLRFCEVCRYDFDTGAAGPAASVPATQPAPSPARTTPPKPAPPPGIDDPNDPFAAEFAALEASGAGAATSAPPATSPPPSIAQPPPMQTPITPIAPVTPVAPAGPLWEVRVAVDPTLDTDPDPSLPVPTNEPDYFYPLTEAETLIGRRDDRQGIRPQIPLRDPGVSRRHAMIRRDTDGVSVMDLGSTNGTMVNGSELPPNSRRLLQAGDEITVGRWTRITLRSETA